MACRRLRPPDPLLLACPPRLSSHLYGNSHSPPPPAADNFGGDPFHHTTMSFGEHLDELRSSLFKAVLSLAIGFGVGMCFNAAIVNLIQRPLSSALAEHARRESLERFRRRATPCGPSMATRYAKAMLADPEAGRTGQRTRGCCPTRSTSRRGRFWPS